MSAGTININIPPDSEKWLFTERNDPRPDAGRLWSFRWQPPCKPGDDILFRFAGRVVAAATVDDVYKPGLLDTVSHHGKRYLSGHKVTWLNSSFIDLRKFNASIDVACNDRYGKFENKFSAAHLYTHSRDEAIELDGGECSIKWLGAHRIKLGRRIYPFADTREFVGNMCWDKYCVDLLTLTAIFNQLLDADFGITCGPTPICDKATAKTPIHWRDLVAVAQEALV